MTVAELREALASMPDHWPVHVELLPNTSTSADDTEYHYTLDCVPSNFPTQGCMAVIRLNDKPT